MIHNSPLAATDTYSTYIWLLFTLGSSDVYFYIFTMVSYFLRWTLLKCFSSIPDEQSQQKVRRLGRITCAVINTSNEVKFPLLWEFWIISFSRRILERVLVRNIVNIRNECLFFWVHGGMNRSAEQTNHSRTASRFTRFVCPALRFIPPWTPKKRHSFLKYNIDPSDSYPLPNVCYAHLSLRSSIYIQHISQCSLIRYRVNVIHISL